MAAKRKYPEGTARSSFFFPPAMKDALKATASRTGRTETEVVHDALRAEFEREASAGRESQPEAFG